MNSCPKPQASRGAASLGRQERPDRHGPQPNRFGAGSLGELYEQMAADLRAVRGRRVGFAPPGRHVTRLAQRQRQNNFQAAYAVFTVI